MAEIPTEAGLRLAIYARVSTEEQREGQTIDSQIAELERFSRGMAHRRDLQRRGMERRSHGTA